MRSHLALVVTLASVFVFGPMQVGAAEFKKIEGEYVVAPRGGQGPLEFGLIVRGTAAEELYASLPGEEKPEACTGGTQKSNPNGMFCIKDGSKFVCSVGYALTTREVSAGPLTC